jgi:hypothetical protein
VADLEGRLHILALEIKSLNQHRQQWNGPPSPSRSTAASAKSE